MTINREVFLKDPTQYTIPNNGVAEVIDPRTKEQWEVLRYELENFVCEGEYKHGLERIISLYLQHLHLQKQPAVWVSGFYGSGKSHFVRILEYLWRDTVFPDGTHARDLVKSLPEDIKDLLRELTTAGKREGGLWSAAGTLSAGAGDSIRLALLSILFRSAGLPESYAPACLAIWLKKRGYYQDVKTVFEQHRPEADFLEELAELYASRDLAESLLTVFPDFAPNQMEVRKTFRAQFPSPQQDVTNDEMLRAIKNVLELQSSQQGKLPCTLIVCDELQQFIGQDAHRTIEVQELVETCCSHFGTRLLFVGTGQASVQGTPQLQKLQGRFTNQVMLSDADVEHVVRNVILSKKPSQIAPLQAALKSVSGEIDRHLRATRIGPTASDSEILISDYPILPVRSRFWELFLRGVDSSGTSGQLRTQLLITHDSIKEIADKPVGTVVAGDVIYRQLRMNMLQSTMLLRDVDTRIMQLDDGMPDSDGRVCSRLCATIFLIGKLQPETLRDYGIRSDVDTLAELLVEDLTTGSAPLRQRIPALLQRLVDDHIVMQVGDEYRIQTREGREWESEYHRRYERALVDDARLATDRDAEFQRALKTSLKAISSINHGQSKTSRKIDLHFGPNPPDEKSGLVPLWLRDEWAISERSIREEALRAGTSSPIIFVFIPKQDTDALKEALASYAAASETLNLRGIPSSPEGREAQTAMESRKQAAENRRNALVEKMVTGARVFQSGGNEVEQSTTLQATVKEAIDDALIRLFPKFSLADHPGWSKVATRARDGGHDALGAINNYSGTIEDHPVCKEVRNFVDVLGKKGSDIRKHFTGAGYGWPQDAVDAALLCLIIGGFLRATKNGVPVIVRELTTPNIGLTDFYREGITVTVTHKIGIRKWLSDMGLQTKQGEEAESIQRVLQQLRDFALAAGGEAPLPERPSTTAIEALQRLTGNEQMVAVHEQRDELLRAFHTWREEGERIARRLPEWNKLQTMLSYARTLPVATRVEPEVEAIRHGRLLLAEPNPVLPLILEVVTALRSALIDFQQRLIEEQEQQLQTIASWDQWSRLPEDERQRLMLQHGLGAVPQLKVGTDEELLAALRENPLPSWEDKIAAPIVRVQKVREETIKLLTPKAVHLSPPPATLTSAEQVDAYLLQFREQMMKHITAGNPVVV